MAGQSLQLRKLFGNIITTLVRQGMSLILGFTVTIILARYLEPQGNGIYAVTVLFASLMVALLNFGIVSANIYFVGRGDVSLRIAQRVTLRLWAALSALGLMIAGLLMVGWGDKILPDTPEYLRWFALILYPPMLLQSLLTGLLQARQDFRGFNKALLAPTVSSLVLSFVGVWALHGGVLSAIVALLVSQLIGIGVTWYLLQPHLVAEQSDHAPPNYARRMISYGWKTHLSNVITFFNYRADLYLVGIMLGVSATGVYVIAVQLAERLWILSQTVSSVLLPRLAELHTNEHARRQLTPIVSRWVLLISCVMSLILTFVLVLIFIPLFGQAYSDALGAFLWLLPGIIAFSFSRVLANDIAARGRPELNIWAAALGLIFNLGINLVAIPRMGINGASLASSIAYSITAALIVFNYTRLSGNHYAATLLLTRDDVKLAQRAFAQFRQYIASRS